MGKYENQPCYYCGDIMSSRRRGKRPTKDHIVPKCLGGGKGKNLVRCCYGCNKLKGCLSKEEFRFVLAYRKGVLGSCEQVMKFHGEK